MKFAGRSLCFAVLLVVLGVAGREVPELFSLTDDVSNDGDVATRVDDAVLPEVRLLGPSQPDPTGTIFAACLAWHNPGYLVLVHSVPAFVVPGPDLLHRLSLQKK
jgi:hypothetical protein